MNVGAYELGGHRVWAATDEVGVVALAGSQAELEHLLTLDQQ
ncbi:hypothetical protein [Frankia sp. AgB32]|nr:hypothetical protein [Frankia sp. AgB32]